MSAAAWKNKTIAVLLYAVLSVIFAPCAHAAKVLDSTLLQNLFPSGRPVKDYGRTVGVAFRVANCPCYALTGKKSIVSYIFVFPAEEERKPRKPTPKTQAAAEHLTEFLAQGYGKAKLHPFSVQESGYVISVNPPRYNASEYGKSFLGLPTDVLISLLINQKGTFHRCDGGELSIKMPAGSAENDSCHVSFSLFKRNADIISFAPGRYTRRSDEKIVTSAVSILDLSTPYTPADYPRYSAILKDVRSSIGATKCIGMSYEWVMVSYRNRYYIGSEADLKDFIRNKKRGGYTGKFGFPQQSDSIPSIGDEVTPKEKGPAQGTPLAPEEDKSGEITAEQICDYFHCPDPVEQGGCVCLLLDNCRVVIPLPDAGDAHGQSPLRLPIKNLYIRALAQSDEPPASQRHASLLGFMLTQPDSDGPEVGVHPSDNTISLLNFPNGIAPKEPKEEEVKELLHADGFPDTEVHPWPEKSRAGETIREDWQALVTLKPDGTPLRKEATPLSPEAALKNYMEYLLRLMK